MTKKKKFVTRVTIDLTDKQNKRLEFIAENLELKKAAVVRESLSLLETVVRLKLQGCKNLRMTAANGGDVSLQLWL